MEVEPSFDPDGSVAAWLCWRGATYVGSVCRTNPGRWLANDADGAVIGVARTRGQALKYIGQPTWKQDAYDPPH